MCLCKFKMSVEDAWKTVNDFQSKGTPSGEDVVELDIAMMIILKHNNAEEHHRRLGYSVRYPRYQKSYPDVTKERELSILREHYWARSGQLSKLNRAIERKQIEFERSCNHKWVYDTEDRDHKSRYVCQFCGCSR